MTASDRRVPRLDSGSRLYASLELGPGYGAGPLPTTRLVLRPARDGHYEIVCHTTYTARDRKFAPSVRNTLARRAVRRSAVDAWITRLRQARIPVLADGEPVLDAGQWTLCLLLGEWSIAFSCMACPPDEASILDDFGQWLDAHAPAQAEADRPA